LVAILDADKEGYLRSAIALIQTMGRCARHINGRAILYADVITDSMRKAMDETDRRRAKQVAYNLEHGITPLSIVKSLDTQLARIVEADYVTVPADDLLPENISTEEDLLQAIAQLETQMREAAKKFEFERAAALRDRIRALQQRELGGLFAALDLSTAQPTPPAPPAAPQAAAPASATPQPSPASHAAAPPIPQAPPSAPVPGAAAATPSVRAKPRAKRA
jgi:Ultra-violet resistance protein B/UvrB/uvrC motif